jgi:hypothetical protein
MLPARECRFRAASGADCVARQARRVARDAVARAGAQGDKLVALRACESKAVHALREARLLHHAPAPAI